jgi:hypothetical protein
MHLFRKINTLAFAFILGLSVNQSAFALDKETAVQALEKTYQATIHSYYSVNGFYNFSANQADQEQQQLIQFSIGTIEDLMIDISGLTSDSDLASQVDNARDTWLTYEESLKANIAEIKRSGYPDLRLAGDMADSNIQFNDALNLLYQSILATSDVKLSKETQLGRDAAKMLALMMTKYSARSTSTVSQVYAGGDAEITIDSLAKDFNSTLNTLFSMIDPDSEAASTLDSAKTKWEFIQPSYANYNENRVNFIVNLYSKKIIEEIETANSL